MSMFIGASRDTTDSWGWFTDPKPLSDDLANLMSIPFSERDKGFKSSPDSHIGALDVYNYFGIQMISDSSMWNGLDYSRLDFATELALTYGELAFAKARFDNIAVVIEKRISARMRRDPNFFVNTAKIRDIVPEHETLAWLVLGYTSGWDELEGGITSSMQQVVDSGIPFDEVIHYSNAGFTDFDSIVGIVKNDIDPRLVGVVNG